LKESLPSLRGHDFSGELLQKGFYHSFELPDGTHVDGYNPVEYLRERWRLFDLPEDLNGRTLLDIGTWDGWFSFEAERHGARVTALDCVEIESFLELRKRLGSSVDYRILDFYELPQSGLGRFDYVLFLGVLYHL
jgi:tRNA (mo5U34)-methyltransferase